MLELIFQGFMEWAYGLTLECWQYFSSSLLDIMSMDFAYLKTHVPVIDDIMQVLMAVGASDRQSGVSGAEKHGVRSWF